MELPSGPDTVHVRWVPTTRLIWLLVATGPLWLFSLLLPLGWLVGPIFLAGLAFETWRQAKLAPDPADLRIRRQVPRRFSFDADHKIEISVRNSLDRPLYLEVKDVPPDALDPATDLAPVLLEPLAGTTLSYSVRSRRRGDYRFGDLHLRVGMPGGLMVRQMVKAASQPIKIYPRLLGSEDVRLLARIDERLDQIKQPRLKRGGGSEFESLRAYEPGEDLRHVDWKASARRGELICRNLQVEKGQQVALLIDCGRLMANRIGRYPRLEHAIDAAMQLAYVCSRRGDYLSVAAFSNRVESLLPPTRGAAAVPAVMETLYRLQARDVESDYWLVVAKILGQFKKRSLVVVLTDVLDSWGSSGLLANLIRAADRHLVLCVAMYEPEVVQLAHSTPGTEEEAFTKAAASHLRLERERALEQMRSRGILILETEPQRMSIQLVRRYLEIRQQDLQ